MIFLPIFRLKAGVITHIAVMGLVMAADTAAEDMGIAEADGNYEEDFIVCSFGCSFVNHFRL
jgi:hypothetical protein